MRYLIIILALIGCEKTHFEDIIEPEPIKPITTKEYIYILMVGQSNCEGMCNDSSSIVYNDSIEIWDGNNWVKPTRLTKGKIALTFAQSISKSEKKRVRILKICQGGNPIENWLPPISVNMDKINQAIVKSGVEQIDIILWSQGEGNSNAAKNLCNNDSCYIKKLNELIGIFTSSDYSSENMYFIATSLLDGVRGHRTSALLSLNDNPNDRLATVENKGFTGCDPVHFDIRTQELIGQLMFDKFVKIRNN